MKEVLIVDDSVTILMSIGDMLEKMGLSVVKASNGKEALQKLQGGLAPAAIISDVNMPVMGGIEFVGEARKLPSIRFTPILMLTTESQQTSREEGRKAGATAWLVKPVGADDLQKIMRKVIPGL